MSDKICPPAFELISTDELEEYRGKGYYFKHKATGCEIYHVHNDDEENVFSFNFRTPPADSSGVAHILEHSVLCGSRNFPVKDPFLSMMKGSVNTFLNAMTYPDKTLYPAASVLEKDFFNLMAVYGDAVFFPMLKEEVFRQEGHRLELDEKGVLQRTGIVYNEMKGNYSSQEGIASEWSIRSLFPDNPYGVDSGGDPEHIPSLSYEQFLEFHKNLYHPSNCRIFLYGDIPSQKTLNFIEERFLHEFDKRDIDSRVALQSSWSAPAALEKSWPLGKGEDTKGKSTISLNWKLFGHGDPVRQLSMSILAEMLIGNAGAPLSKALLESGLGDDLSPVSGVDFDLNEAVFSVALRGTDPDKADDLQKLVFRTLGDLAEKGFEEDLKESCLRLVEFRDREIKGGGPFGMRLLRKVMKGWNYGLAPEQSIRFSPVIKEIRKRAEEPGYFESILREWVLENHHWTRVTVRPDTELQSRQEKALREELDRLQKDFSEEDLKVLEEKNKALQAFQDAEDTGAVPFLRKSDIPVKVKRLPFEEIPSNRGTVLGQSVFTNGILYNDMAFSLKHLDPAYYPYLPLFSKLLAGCGLPGVSYDRITRELSLKTGGFAANLEAGHKVGDAPDQQPEVFLYTRLKMLEGQRQEALELASSLMLNADFDNLVRIEQILMELWNDMKSSLVPGGHSYVLIRGASRFSSSAALEDRMFGIGQVQFLEQLLNRKDRLPELAALMKDLRAVIFNADHLILNLTMDEQAVQDHREAMVQFWMETLPDSAAESPVRSDLASDIDMPAPAPALTEAEGLGIGASIGFVGKAVRGSSLEEKAHAADSLLSHLLKTGPLWEKIRMKGGAYGAFSHLSGLDRIFSFATYRDPEIEKSLDAFEESLKEYLEFSDDEELEKALISVVGKEMKPLSPSEKGMIVLKRRLYNISDEMRQNKRDYLMNCGTEEIRKAGDTLLSRWNEDGITVMAHPEKLDKASIRFPGLKANRVELPQ
ncbi:MAG: insulinase family protein [Spirochaetales bacterium]|nr:insulinase family protein [Spirochaetales bacterium]